MHPANKDVEPISIAAGAKGRADGCATLNVPSGVSSACIFAIPILGVSDLTTTTIDHHCHILPGLDDGCRSRSDALLMATRLAAAGFTTVYCTPHCIRGLYETEPRQIRDLAKRLQDQVDGAGLSLQVLPGMEYYLDEYFFDRLEDPVTLGESDLLLFETPSSCDKYLLMEAIYAVGKIGLRPLLAHPERYPFLSPRFSKPGFFGSLFRPSQQHECSLPLIYHEILELGCLLQGNLGSLSGFYGPEVRDAALAIRRAGGYHCFGTDAHSPEQLEKILDKLTPGS